MACHRFVLDDLISWARQLKRKPLIIRGARQVGKSTTVRLLAEKMKLQLIEINLERQREYASLFKEGDPQTTLQLLALKFNVSIKPGESLLFLDEIQTCPELLAILRYFYEEMPELHIVCAGSLLEFALKNLNFSMPVGRIEYCYMGPMTFSEFLLALNFDKLVEYLQNFQLQQNIPEAIHNQFMLFTKIYHILGGMPEAVYEYANTNDWIRVERVKHSILETYKDDFSKYSSPKHDNQLRETFNKIPLLIGSKVKYSHINPHVKSTAIAAELEKLTLARVIYMVHHSAANGIPLGAEINSKIMKPLFLDVGLLSTQLGINYLDTANINELTLINNGVIAEQFIGQHLLYSTPFYQRPELYYWQREKKSSQAEVDYVISHGQYIIPVEIKAGKTGRLRSLQVFIEEKHPVAAVRFNSDYPSLLEFTNGQPCQLLSLPFYLVEQVQRLLGLLVKIS